MEQHNWCRCKGHLAKDFVALTDFYCNNFIPTAYSYDGRAPLNTELTEHYLYLYGRCATCGGFMRSGSSIANQSVSYSLLSAIYGVMRRYQPFPDSLLKRGEWYKHQNELSPLERNLQFLDIFHEKDQPFVKEWLELSGGMDKDPDISPTNKCI